MEMPINLHIIIGVACRPGTVGLKGHDRMRLIRLDIMKMLYAMNALIQFIGAGALDGR
jgi:hypothetical protein